MSDESAMRTGQVSTTPEGGPIDEGAPPSVPGAGQVRPTPEAGLLTPPTLRDHMQGPILGLDDVTPPSPSAAEPSHTRTAHDDAELKKWPPYSGKPVSEVHWDDARRFAAPLVSQAEKLTIQAIGFTGRGLSRLARVLEDRRAAREGEEEN
jgi:hypothetical protein